MSRNLALFMYGKMQESILTEIIRQEFLFPLLGSPALALLAFLGSSFFPSHGQQHA